MSGFRMPVLTVGSRSIPYVVRRTSRAQRRRIVVTPEQVEVVAPEGHSDEEIAAFVHSRRRWVHDQTERMQERTLFSALPERFVTGAKILYRGRRLKLTVSVGEGKAVEIEHRGGFHVHVPSALAGPSRDAQIEAAFQRWFRERVRADAEHFVRRYAPRLGLESVPIRIRAQKHLWGSCGRDGTISLNWHLVFAPRAVLEYAVVHELCHSIDRSHGPGFWSRIGRVMPDYDSRKGWLEANELNCR